MLDWFSQNEFFISITLVTALLTLSNFVVFQAGVFSLATIGFMAVGAYTSAVLTTTHGAPVVVGLVVAVVLGAVFALVVGLLTLRLDGIYLALATFALAQAILGTIRGLKGVTNGVLGIAGMPLAPTAWIAAGSIVVLGTGFELVRRSRHGRAFTLVRHDQVVARGLGVNVRGYRLLALVASGAIAALAGALNAHTVGVISPEQYNFSLLVLGLTYAIVGGVTHWSGPLVAAILLGIFHHAMRDVSTDVETLVYGVLLIGVVFVAPRGLGDPRLRAVLGRHRLRGLLHAGDGPTIEREA